MEECGDYIVERGRYGSRFLPPLGEVLGGYVRRVHVAAASGLCEVLAATPKIVRIAVSRSARRIGSPCSEKNVMMVAFLRINGTL